MTTGLHKDLTGTNIHVPFTWTYANAGARTGATGFVSSDIGKFARQSDDNSIWMLTATTPTWIQTGMYAHASTHQSGGSDVISVTGLTGLLSTAQTPIAHATSHKTGGSDFIRLDEFAATTDNTNLNASITAHGLLPKLSNVATQYLDGQGGWSVPAGGNGGGLVSGTMVTELLFEQTLEAAGNFDIQSISQAYDMLMARMTLRGTVSSTSDAVYTFFNNDTTLANYRALEDYSTDTNTTYTVGDNPRTLTCPANTSLANDFSFHILYIPRYTVTTINKNMLFEACNRRSSTLMTVGIGFVNWENTAAINRITIQPDGYDTDKFASGSWVRLFGTRIITS